MQKISDIRLYKSSEKAQHVGFTSKSLNIAVHRVAMKLREQNFSFGEFDHLYLNFTTCRPAGEVELIDTVDRYHPWYRYCDIGVSQNEYEKLEADNWADYIYVQMEAVLLSLFSAGGAAEIIKNAIIEAQKGSEMLMYFKGKKSAKGIATIFLRLLDNGKYFPLLCVTDLNGNEVFRADLPEMIDLNGIGEIQLSSKKVTVKPRKNGFAKGLEPISFELK